MKKKEKEKLYEIFRENLKKISANTGSINSHDVFNDALFISLRNEKYDVF